MNRPLQPFHAFTIAFEGYANQIITEVKILEGFDLQNPPNPLPIPIATNALWDTGASRSVITKSTADRLNLIPVGTARVNHAGGSGMQNTHIVNFLLPNTVGVAGVMVTECPDAHNFGAIIGMDIISQGDMAITNVNGKTCMSFRVPSVRRIDYVQEANQLIRQQVRPNDPCPCNSGRKYKKCHGATAN